MMDTNDGPPRHTNNRCHVMLWGVEDYRSMLAADRRTMIGGPIHPSDLDVAFGALMLHEPELVERLLVLDELFVDGGPHA